MREITVRDPNRPDRPADLLVSGDERVPLDPAVRRRRLRVVGALLLVGALVLAGTEVRERRAQAAEERRLGAVVELRAEHQGGTSSFDPTTRTGRLTMELLLHNDGPRDVQALAARMAGYELLGGGARVEAGRSARVLLQRTVTCDGTEPVPPPEGLRLTVRTVTTEREVEVDLPADQDEALRLCGYRPLETMSISFGDMARHAPDVVDLGLDLQTQAAEPVHLVGLVAQPGIVVRLRVGGTARALPVELVTDDGLTRVLSTRVELTVSDCDAALAPSEPDLPDPGAPSGLLVQVRDASGETGDFQVGYPDRLMDSLLGYSCGSRAS